MKPALTKITVRLLAGLLLALVAAGSGVLSSKDAFAQEAPRLCQARKVLITQLDRQYGEAPVAIGVTEGNLLELLTAKDGVTWTLILTTPRGVSCLIAAGEGWRPVVPKKNGPTV